MRDNKTVKEVVMVSAGLGLDGGGSAALGRLIARATAEFCQERGLRFHVLHLGRPVDCLPGLDVTHFSGDQKALAVALWRRQARANDLALVFDHPGPARTQAYLPAFACAPYLVFLLGIEVWRPLGWERRRALQKAAVRLAISEHTWRKARRFSPWLPPAEVLYLALEERPPRGKVDEVLLEKAGRDTILIVSRMPAAQPYKGHDELLAAWPTVLTAHPQARLVVAGDGDDRPRLEAIVAADGLQDHVLFTGFVSEATLEKLYERCAIFAMPSRNEGFGLVYLAAMKAGKPCIATRDCAAGEVVLDGQTGLLVEFGRADQVAQALLRLMDNPELAGRLGAAGRQRWQNCFRYAAFRDGLHSHLWRLVGGQRMGGI
ncbi:MAG: glycosyltransferase family 4 protein [Chloroflexota bacterium]